MSHPQAEAKWSPAALERQMAAELARLESLGDSLQQLSSMERTRAVALAQQETVSLAQILKVSEISGCGRPEATSLHYCCVRSVTSHYSKQRPIVQKFSSGEVLAQPVNI